MTWSLTSRAAYSELSPSDLDFASDLSEHDLELKLPSSTYTHTPPVRPPEKQNKGDIRMNV